jgi:hypothetical protein
LQLTIECKIDITVQRGMLAAKCKSHYIKIITGLPVIRGRRPITRKGVNLSFSSVFDCHLFLDYEFQQGIQLNSKGHKVDF